MPRLTKEQFAKLTPEQQKQILHRRKVRQEQKEKLKPKPEPEELTLNEQLERGVKASEDLTKMMTKPVEGIAVSFLKESETDWHIANISRNFTRLLFLAIVGPLTIAVCNFLAMFASMSSFGADMPTAVRILLLITLWLPGMAAILMMLIVLVRFIADMWRNLGKWF